MADFKYSFDKAQQQALQVNLKLVDDMTSRMQEAVKAMGSFSNAVIDQRALREALDKSARWDLYFCGWCKSDLNFNQITVGVDQDFCGPMCAAAFKQSRSCHYCGSDIGNSYVDFDGVKYCDTECKEDEDDDFLKSTYGLETD